MNHPEKFEQFKQLHIAGNPIILYNIWNAGSAKMLAEAGALAVATGSKPLALAQGYPDGEVIPVAHLLETVRQIVQSVEIPVSVDFEGGYAKSNQALLVENIAKLLNEGIVGINFEDQVIGGEGVFDVPTQKSRIAAVRNTADNMGSPLFINARTDLFLQQKDQSKHAGLLAAAKARADAYQEAGADGFFAPGLYDLELITDLCRHTELPVNIIKTPKAPSIQALADSGVGRISFGPYAYLELMAALRDKAGQLYGE